MNFKIWPNFGKFNRRRAILGLYLVCQDWTLLYARYDHIMLYAKVHITLELHEIYMIICQRWRVNILQDSSKLNSMAIFIEVFCIVFSNSLSLNLNTNMKNLNMNMNGVTDFSWMKVHKWLNPIRPSRREIEQRVREKIET